MLVCVNVCDKVYIFFICNYLKDTKSCDISLREIKLKVEREYRRQVSVTIIAFGHGYLHSSTQYVVTTFWI